MKPISDIMRTPLGESILAFAKLDDAAAGEDDKTGQRTQYDAVGHQLQPQCYTNGKQGHPDMSEVELDRFGLGIQDLGQIVLARFAIADEYRNQQAQYHTGNRNGHRQRDLAGGDGHAVIDQVLGQNVVQEDAAKADRQHHIGGGQAKGDDTGHLTTVDLHLRHYMQQRRDQNGNKGDMNRDQVLGRDGHGQHGREQQGFNPHDAGRAGILAQLADHLAGQQVGDPGAGDGNRKGAQHGVGEGNLGTTAQATTEGSKGIGQRQPAHQAASNGPQRQRDHHIDPQQTEHQHQPDCDNNRIHLISL